MSEVNRLTLWSRRTPEGELLTTWLLEQGGALALVEESAPGTPDAPLPVAPQALLATFTRYGRALEPVAVPPRQPGEILIDVPRAGAAATVRRFAFRGFGDVIPTDYLVLEIAGQEPLAAPANMIVPALAVVSRAAARAAAQRA